MIGGTSLLEIDRGPAGELKEPRGGLWGPLWWPETTTKVAVVAVCTDAARDSHPLQVSLKLSGAHYKNGNIMRMMGP